MLQIEDLSQQVHRAAAEKFKVPSEPSALVPESAPGPRVRPECEEEEEEEEEEVRPRGPRLSLVEGGSFAWGLSLGEGAAPAPPCISHSRWTRQDWSCGTSSW